MTSRTPGGDISVRSLWSAGQSFGFTQFVKHHTDHSEGLNLFVPNALLSLKELFWIHWVLGLNVTHFTSDRRLFNTHVCIWWKLSGRLGCVQKPLNKYSWIYIHTVFWKRFSSPQRQICILETKPLRVHFNICPQVVTNWICYLQVSLADSDILKCIWRGQQTNNCLAYQSLSSSLE